MMKKDIIPLDKVNHGTFVLGVLGLLTAPIPVVGGAVSLVSAQVQAHQNKIKLDRMEAAISKLKARLSAIPKVINESIAADLEGFVQSALDDIAREHLDEKREILIGVAAELIKNNIAKGKREWFFNALNSTSLDALLVFRYFLDQKPLPTHRQQYHSHTPVMDYLSHLYTYEYLVILLKELDRLGVLEFQPNSTSIGKPNEPRFIVWWNQVALQFADYLRE